MARRLTEDNTEIIRDWVQIQGKASKCLFQRCLTESPDDSSSLVYVVHYVNSSRTQSTDNDCALDAQLLMDESLENILSQQPSDEVVTATAALTISDTGTPQEDQPAQEHQNSNQDALPFIPNQDVPSSMLQPIQLRRLELPTFDRDVTKFYDFWCRFKTAVHDNTNLLLSTKFIYLTNSLKGYDPSKPENYQLAVQALRRRCDRPKFTHNLFHQKLEQLPASSHSASVQRDTLSQIQSFILQLNRYEDTTTSLAPLKTILKKFPRETQLEVHKLEHHSGKTWTLPELIDGLNEVIEELEKLEDCAISTSGSQLTTNTVSVDSSRSSTPEPRYDLSMCSSEITPLTTVTFGGIRTTEHSGITDVTLIDQQNKKLQLVPRTKDKITIPCPPKSHFHQRTSSSDLIDPISRFDNLDVIGVNDNPDPSFDREEDAQVLQRFQDTVQEIDGHLYVQFPWRKSHPRLADNKLLALKRLESQYR
ncbi:hypothetical protein OSTOST_04217 [Ostertagia ostertagi]